jgi:hypothetical protein
MLFSFAHRPFAKGLAAFALAFVLAASPGAQAENPKGAGLGELTAQALGAIDAARQLAAQGQLNQSGVELRAVVATTREIGLRTARLQQAAESAREICARRSGELELQLGTALKRLDELSIQLQKLGASILQAETKTKHSESAIRTLEKNVKDLQDQRDRMEKEYDERSRRVRGSGIPWLGFKYGKELDRASNDLSDARRMLSSQQKFLEGAISEKAARIREREEVRNQTRRLEDEKAALATKITSNRRASVLLAGAEDFWGKSHAAGLGGKAEDLLFIAELLGRAAPAELSRELHGGVATLREALVSFGQAIDVSPHADSTGVFDQCDPGRPSL